MIFIGYTLRMLLWTHAAFFLLPHLAFISVESFFRTAELIGLRLALWLNVGLFFGPQVLRFCFVHHTLCHSDFGTCYSAYVTAFQDPSFGGRSAREVPCRAAIASSIWVHWLRSSLRMFSTSILLVVTG